MSSVRREHPISTGDSIGVWLEGRRILLLIGLAAICAGLSVAALAQEAPRLLTQDAQKMLGDSLRIISGHSEALRTTWKIKRVSVADPTVADVEALEPNEVLIVAKDIGETDLILWGENGEIWSTSIYVDMDIDGLNQDLARLFPRTGVSVTRAGNVYFVSGVLETANQAQQMHNFLEAGELEYVDMSTVAGLQQVQIQVRVAEVNRVAIKKMGVNLLVAGSSFFGAGMIGPSSGGALNGISISPVSGALASASNVPFVFDDFSASPFNTLLLGFPKADLEFFIQALAENQYLHILAEPTLVALSGEEASFLVGGEFPIPVAQDSGGGGTAITIEWKEFGIRLSFTPTVLGNGNIRLHVAPEVSELSNIGAVEIQGFFVPAIISRRAETTLELKSGQTFSMAGLLSENTQSRNSRVPLLGDLPILGSLFRSVSYQKGQSELVVMVTATLVEPLSHAGNRPLPGDLHVDPSDWDLFMNGRLEGKVKDLAEVSDDSVDMGELGGLKGPGAWANYYESDEEYTGTKAVEVNVTSD